MRPDDKADRAAIPGEDGAAPAAGQQPAVAAPEAVPLVPDQAEASPEPAQAAAVRDVGIEIAFAPDSILRGVRANLIYSALLNLGEVVWFYPNFVIAADQEMETFLVTLRTAAPWEEIYAAVVTDRSAEITAVREVPAHSEGAGAPAAPAAQPAPMVSGADVEQERPATGAAADAAATDQRSIRVNLDRLEDLSNLVGELAVEKAHLLNLATRLEAVCVEGESRRLALDLRRSVGKLASVTGQLQELSTELRMVPVGTLFRRFTRLVRELAGSTGKRLILRREGEETMLDKAIIEEMADPLLHLIRNAADHGIEPAADRLRAGKPEAGTITLRAYDQGDQVVIEVADDGRGINVDRLREKAVERGFLTSDAAAALSTQEALQLIFLPGLSTAARVTDISGRGVGMDVVKANVERLRGSIAVDTTPGQGTRVTVRLPLTVSVVSVMLAEVLDQVVAVPVASLGGLVRLNADNRIMWGSVLYHQGRMVPLVDLAHLWWQERGTGGAALLLSVAGEEMALVVDRTLGMGDVVVKPLGDYVGRLPGVSGAAVLGDGRVSLVLDPTTLLNEQHREEGAAPLDLAIAG